MLNQQLAKLLQTVLQKLNYPTENVEVIVSNRKDLCDYQYDGAFKLAKILHKSPLEIGSEIVTVLNNLPESSDLFQKVELLPPGFLNFTLSDSFINQILNQMKNEEKYHIKFPNKKKIIIDYGGPNIAKPLHVGHLRSAIVGESIKRMLKYAGNEVISDVHLGDYGLQIGEVIYGLQEKEIPIDKITLKDLEEIYPNISERCKKDEDLKEKCALITKQLQENNPEYHAYFEKIKEISGNDILRIYEYLDVSFDLWKGESDAYPFITKLTKILEEKHLLEESEGAKIISVEKETDKKALPPLIYQKSNGAYLYGTTDLATIYERMEKYHPDEIIYVTDYRQKMHFDAVFRVCEKIGYTKTTIFEHLGFGTVNGRDGKPFKTRSGTSPKLDTLFAEVKESFLNSSDKNKEMSEKDLDIIVNAIIKFADLQNNYEKDYIFDISKFASVVGKTGPYILYTYLRIESILKNETIPTKDLNKSIYEECDRKLRLKLLELEQTLLYAVENKSPSVLANYIYDLCVNMNAFYEKNHINKLEEKEKKENWLILLSFSNKVIKDMIDLLGIKIPERM